MVTRSSWSRRFVTALAVLSMGLSMTALAAPALATNPPGNNGTVKIHDGVSDTEPIVKNEPHVCTFHLHFFFGDDVQAGDWWIKSWPPTGDGSVVLSGSYDATGGEDVQPEQGVYTLDPGHYKLFWEGATNPGGQLEIKHKVFWVECDEESPSGSGSASASASASTPSGEPDTEITKSASVSEIEAGGSYYYTLTGINNGTADAIDVTIWDDLDKDLTVDDVVPSQGFCDPVGPSNEIMCHVGNLEPGESATVTIYVTASLTDCSPVKNRGHINAENEEEVSHSNEVIVNLTCEEESESASASASASASTSGSESESASQSASSSATGSTSGTSTAVASHSAEQSVQGGQGSPGGDLPDTSTGGSAWTVGWGALLLASAMALFMTRRRGEVRAR